jgi:hypothetical protein
MLKSHKNFKCKYWFKLACYCTKTIFKLKLESISMINYYFEIYLGHLNIALFSISAVFEVLGKGASTFLERL